jgi:hypothetical protein
MAKIGACTCVMAVAVILVPLPVGWAGLIGGIGVGVLAYVGAAIAVDLGGTRRLLSLRPAIVAAVDPAAAAPALPR